MLKYNEFGYFEWIIKRWYPHYFKPLFYNAFDNLKGFLYNLGWLILFPFRVIAQLLHLIMEFGCRLFLKIFNPKLLRGEQEK